MPERLVRETPCVGSAGERLAAAAPAPRIWLRDPALDHRPIRVQTLADGHEAELVETAEHRQIRGREGSVVHVEVFQQMMSVRTSIIGRPRPSPGHRRTQPTTPSTTKSRFLLLGLIAGAIARLIIPGKQRGGWFVTLLLGVVGAMLGGWLGGAIFHVSLEGFFNLSTWLLAVGGSVDRWWCC